MGESKKDALRVNFDNKLKFEFHGVKVASDAGLLASKGQNYVLRELKCEISVNISVG